MGVVKCGRLIALAIGGIVLSGGAIAAQKYDAALARIVSLPSGKQVAQLTATPKVGAAFVETLLRFDGDSLARVTAAGGQVRSVLGNIATVDIPIERISEIADLPEVVYIEAAKRQVQRLNYSVTATRANLLRSGTAPNWTGLGGANVIVGIIDDGLAFRHGDFRKPNGDTRLIELWDQRTAGAAGTPPSDYAYGGVCTAAMMNAAIGGNAASCTQPSTGNHGTHVGGIAAGNGQGTGNGQPAYRFVGMAPQADILAANSLNAGAPGSAVVDAVAWMKARAQALGKPLVINLSLGSYFGPRDGTSNYELALSNASGPGVIITGAAGNEGNDAIRAVGTISQGETKTVTFDWANTVNSDQKFEMWYPGANQYSIKVTGPGVNCGTSTFVAAGSTQNFPLGCGTIEVVSTDVQTNNDDRQILVNFTRAPGNLDAFKGAWTIELQGVSVASANTPFSIICGETGSGLLFTSNTEAVTRSILTDSATATRVVAVAAYNTNYNWLTLGGGANTPPNHGPIGDVSTFSSRGPRRDCSNLAKCPVVMKPEITAPGAMIMAALGNDAPVPTDGTVEQDGVHVAYNGTSMATPHVSGAIALMLQKNPQLTPEAVKRILAETRQTNAFTTNLPTFNVASPLMPSIQNDHFGYGILDAKAAADAVATGAKRFDFNGDGKSDMLYRNDVTGQVYIAGLNGLSAGPVSGFAVTVPNLAWQVVGVADFNGDAKSDLLYWNNTTGEVYVYLLDGTTILGGAFAVTVPNLAWKIVGVADFNGDGKADILYRNDTTGQTYIYFMNGTATAGGGFVVTVSLAWKVVGVADLNGDGKADLLYRNDTTGQVFVYLLNGTNIIGSGFALTEANLAWKIVGVADFNGDGKADLLYRNDQTGQTFIYFMNGTATAGGGFAVTATLPWKIVGVGDYDGDGKGDLLYRNDTTGQVFIYLLNGTAITGSGFVYNEPNLAWKIVN